MVVFLVQNLKPCRSAQPTLANPWKTTILRSKSLKTNYLVMIFVEDLKSCGFAQAAPSQRYQNCEKTATLLNFTLMVFFKNTLKLSNVILAKSWFPTVSVALTVVLTAGLSERKLCKPGNFKFSASVVADWLSCQLW